jgi:hypothetical protein
MFMIMRDKNVIFRIALVLLILAVSIPLFHIHAADAGSSLFMPVSAAHLGRGAVSTSGAMDASDVYRYTANSALAGGGQFLIGQTETADGIRGWYGVAVLPVFYSSAVGIFAKSGMTADGSYAAPDAVGVSLAKYYNEYGFGFGGHFAFLESDISRNGTNRFGALGADLRIDPAAAFSARAYYLNAGIPMRLRSSSITERLDDQYGVVVNYYPIRSTQDFWGVDLGVGAQKTGRDAVVLGTSAEFGVNRQFFARVGYENAVDREPDVSGLSMGLGLLVGGLGADYGYRFGTAGDGGVWAVNARLHIERLKRRDVDGNLALARRYFSKKRYRKASLYSRRVLALDSAQWSARAMQVRSDAEVRREKGREIAIIYGGNSRGVVIPYPPSPDALGGISRHAAVVSALRKAWPRHFAIDVGNMMSAENHLLKVEMAAAYYDVANFDAIAPGEGELAMGPWKFMEAQRRALPIVITNLHDNDPKKSGIWSSLLMSSKGYSVYLLNLICGSVLSDSATFDFGLDIGTLRSFLASERGSGADLRVAVVHGNLDEIKKIAKALPEINIIIAGSLKERFDMPLIVGDTYILSAGSENRFAGCFTIRLDENRRGGSVDDSADSADIRTVWNPGSRIVGTNRLYPICQSVVPDSAVENITRLVSASIIVEESRQFMVPVRTAGVIPHLSERGDGEVGAFIKAMESRKEYPLSEGIANARRAAFSPAANRAAFIHGDTARLNGTLRMVDLGAMNSVTVSSGRNVMEAAFSPASGFLYYIAADSGSLAGAIYKTKIYMYDAIPVVPSDGTVRRDLSVSEDGASLLFCSQDKDGRWHIYAVDSSAATAPVRLTGGGADHRYPRLSPNGRYTAYLSNRTGFGGQMDLWVFERNSTAHRQLTFSANVRDFSWGDDSETVYFSSGVNMTEISRVGVKETAAVRLIPPPQNTAKTWSENTPRFIRYNGAPMVVYTKEFIDGSKRIFWYDINTGNNEKLYTAGDHNEWLGEGW